MTTAVLEPEMMAPRQMHWTMSNPMNVPAMTPPRTISGSWMTATSMANIPCFLIFFRLISRPMQNISMTRPMSDRISMTISASAVTTQTFAMMIPATMYPIRGGSLILLKMIEQAAASNVKTAKLVRSVVSSTYPPVYSICRRLYYWM